MNLITANIISGAILLLGIGAPAYLVVLKRRFWFAIVICWLLLVVGEQFSVSYALSEHASELSPDTTNVGIMMFFGWIVALPYCAFLLLIRFILNKIQLIRSEPNKGKAEQDAAANP
jgi:hypothetical protein